MESKQERVVRMVGIRDVESPQVESGTAGHSGQVGIQEVVALFVQLGVTDAEYFVELRASGFDLGRRSASWTTTVNEKSPEAAGSLTSISFSVPRF